MKMGGFMCRSPGATSVCVPDDVRSVIVPRRPSSRRESFLPADERNAMYSRLLVHDQEKRLPVKSCTQRDHFLSMADKNIDPQASTYIFQVVVLRVSLHCQGCAGKVKKHLSRMEGVTSFSIELETKRVTVMGHVSPAEVLESISKIKRAEFWPS